MISCNRFPHLLLILTGLMGFCPTPGTSQNQTRTDDASPKTPSGINAGFLNPDLDGSQYVERFEREGREVFDHRHDLIRIANVKPGDRVADIGAGTGLHTMLFAKEVGPEGKVYAVDISAPMLQVIQEKKTQRGGLPQLETILCTDKSTRLPAQSIDLAFVCDTYHHFEHPRETLASIHQALRPGGRMMIIDFQRIEGKSSKWAMNHMRAGKEVFRQEIEEGGFKFLEEVAMLKDSYILLFRKEESTGH